MFRRSNDECRGDRSSITSRIGRCDLRVTRSCTPFMVEINPHRDVYYPFEDPGGATFALRTIRKVILVSHGR
jgi:hypothetical protein